MSGAVADGEYALKNIYFLVFVRRGLKVGESRTQGKVGQSPFRSRLPSFPLPATIKGLLGRNFLADYEVFMNGALLFPVRRPGF